MDGDTLREAVARLASGREVAALFSHLGYESADEPFDDDAFVAGRWRGFRVIALEEPGRDRVRALAARLARSGERVLVVGFEPDAVVLSAPRLGAPGCTPLLVVPLAAPSALVLQQLEQLRPRQRDTALGHALRVAEVLSSEAAGRRFFEAFRAILGRMTAALDRRASLADRRMAALLQLTRVLFLYFVQAKGWLAGRPDFLRDALDDTLARRQGFHRSVLHPLFFGTLNRRPAERSGVLKTAPIPYLNGGLFEPHPVERRLGPVLFSNELWRDAFDDVFERFQFCVREADEANAIAPDMLGHVFERVMDGEERHVTGTFYTPASVVRDVVGKGIETALAGRAGITPALAHRVIGGGPLTRAEARRVGRALHQLRILDPAAGSGAFLLGAFEQLVDIRLRLEPRRGPGWHRRIRRSVLRHNLFGVDLSPVAVRLAELRLWLAVIADDPVTDFSHVAPLPNLDGVVRQGDSLLDAVGALRALAPATFSASAPTSAAVTRARAALFEARGAARSEAARQLREAELAWAREAVSAGLARVEMLLDELATVARQRDLFGHRTRLPREHRALHAALKRHRHALQRAGAAVADGTVPFFSFEVHAPEIVARGGFDVVLGNPPWVRAERLPAAARGALAARFTWWRSSRTRGYGHLPDLSVAFLERALELTAPGGAVALLVPSKVATAAYGQAARAHMVRETTIAYLHRVSDKEASGFGATTYPLVTVLKKERAPADHVVQLSAGNDATVPQRSLASEQTWLLVPDRARAALEDLRAAGRPLEQVAAPSLGLKTGADRMFVGELRQTNGALAAVVLDGAAVWLETAILRPALRGREIRPFRAASRRMLLTGYGASGDCLAQLPARAAAYVAARANRLRARADYVRGPAWMLFRVRTALRPNRVVWPDIARTPVAVALDETSCNLAVPLNTCYVAGAPDRETALAIAAVMNSTWARAAAVAAADEARGGYRRINARVAGTFPVPGAGPATAALCALSAAAHLGQLPTQDDLDEAVADALQLSAPTRAALRQLVAARR